MYALETPAIILSDFMVRYTSPVEREWTGYENWEKKVVKIIYVLIDKKLVGLLLFRVSLFNEKTERKKIKERHLPLCL